MILYRLSCLRVVTILLLGAFGIPGIAAEPPRLGTKLSDDQAAQLAKLALDGIDREYPNKPSNVMTGPETVLSPKAMHPAFYGCFDWHSSVHGHWVLIKLLKTNPNHSLAQESRKKLNEHLTAQNLQLEADHFKEKENRSFERMYGWAWLLRVVQEVHEWDDAEGKAWRANLKPLEQTIVELTMNYLPRLSYPIRTGVHPDTAFALGHTLDYARAVGNSGLEKLVTTRALVYYEKDIAYNDAFEPSGEDFFSQCLNEADFMRRVLDSKTFAQWLERFLPSLSSGSARVLNPVEVSDVTDGKLVHLAGLDLSRAWTLLGVANALPPEDARKNLLLASATKHADVGFSYVFSGHYEGEHWLGTFAVFTLTRDSSGAAIAVASQPAKQQAKHEYESKPSDARFAKFNPRKAPTSQPKLVEKGDRLAIIGDSITEQKMYSRMIETYLTVCYPELAVEIRQYGWSGERADGFLNRMEKDCLTFKPTLATLCYGMNDSRYRPYDDINGDQYKEQYTEIVRRLKARGARVVVGSPGCAGKLAAWVNSRSGTLDEHNLHLCTLRDLALEVSQEQGTAFADIFWPMYVAQVTGAERYPAKEGAATYEVAGKDGIHPGWAGQTMMAYAFLKGMGLDGDLGTLEVDWKSKKATCTNGHDIDDFADGLLKVTSHRYPFCASGPVDDDNSLRSGMTLVPFHQELNRFVLKIVNGNAAKWKVTWGEQSKEFSGEALQKGILLADEFPNNPFSGAFQKVDERVLAKQAFETKQVKELFHSQRANGEFAQIVSETEKERSGLVAAIRESFKPVTHSIKIEEMR